jgi:hypothetical protein
VLPMCFVLGRYTCDTENSPREHVTSRRIVLETTDPAAAGAPGPLDNVEEPHRTAVAAAAVEA